MNYKKQIFDLESQQLPLCIGGQTVFNRLDTDTTSRNSQPKILMLEVWLKSVTVIIPSEFGKT